VYLLIAAVIIIGKKPFVRQSLGVERDSISLGELKTFSWLAANASLIQISLL